MTCSHAGWHAVPHGHLHHARLHTGPNSKGSPGSAMVAATAAVLLIATLSATTPASAGGFAIREQSASSQGASFAGNAAGGDLSSMFWNPAAATVRHGFNTESHYSLIIPQAEIEITSASHPNSGALNGAIQPFSNNSGNIGAFAITGSSYFNYQFTNFDPNLFLGMALTSPFGLKTDLDHDHDRYKGAVVGRESRLLTVNVSPTLAYKLSSALSVGVGAQVQYGDGRFSFATGLPSGADTRFDGSGWALGATAGVLWTPSASTSIGLGWRSQLSQKLDGVYINTPTSSALGFRSVAAEATLELPNIVTFSVRQAVLPNARLLGTVEWSQWSRFKELRLTSTGGGLAIVPNTTTGGGPVVLTPGATIGVLPADWSDGWMFALGGEYDLNRALTVRAGGAYELSPVDQARKRLIGIPDNDRIWASLGATYSWSASTSFDLAYTHLFVKDSQIDRDSLSGFNVKGNVEASTDIVSVAIKTKW